MGYTQSTPTIVLIKLYGLVVSTSHPVSPRCTCRKIVYVLFYFPDSHCLSSLMYQYPYKISYFLQFYRKMTCRFGISTLDYPHIHKNLKMKIFDKFFTIFLTKPEITRSYLLIPYYSNTINFVVRENEISIRYSAFTEWKKFFRFSWH